MKSKPGKKTPKTPKQPPTTRDWSMNSEGQVLCFKSDRDKCEVVSRLLSPKRPSEAHDDELMRCTKEINAILENVRRTNFRKNADLHLLKTPRGLLLVWARCDTVGSDDDPATIDKAFAIG